MDETAIIPTNSSLAYLGLDQQTKRHWNLSPDALAQQTVNLNQGTFADSGALCIDTGEFTGRSPKDRFIVEDDITRDYVWWGDINMKFNAQKFDALYKKVIDYLKDKELYVRDAYACANEAYRLNLRLVSEYPWSNMFAYNMFLRPTDNELQNFTPEWNVVNAPGFKANASVDGTRQHNFAIINFTKKIILIGGTGYTGEIKKGIFSVLNFILPHQKNVLPMHCSANVGKKGDTAIFFGLSGTGKTTLSADANRKLIGDDEHGWANDSVFNFEGGCYAKCIDLSPEKEPEIYGAIKQGAILENIVFKNGTKEPDYANSSKTQNTRVSYPIHHIENIMVPSKGGAPKHIFFLTADAYGVLPPISKLTKAQAMYYFISGYTAKVAGTEAGVVEPQTVFSACFGAPFLPLHPNKYAEMLGKKIDQTGANVWLVNTGWTGGAYGTGERIRLKYTRAMIKAALNGSLGSVNYQEHRIFSLQMPTSCQDVPSEILNPRNTWENQEDYKKQALELAEAFVSNFKQFESGVSHEILSAAPKVQVSA